MPRVGQMQLWTTVAHHHHHHQRGQLLAASTVHAHAQSPSDMISNQGCPTVSVAAQGLSPSPSASRPSLLTSPTHPPPTHTHIHHTSAQVCKTFWDVRKGLIPIVGAAREPGTSMLIEDVACPVDKLADMMIDLIDMFQR